MSAATEKARRLDAEAALTIARRALEKIAHGHAHGRVESVASEALDEMFRVGQKQPLQGIVGHEHRTR